METSCEELWFDITGHVKDALRKDYIQEGLVLVNVKSKLFIM